MSKKLGRNDPCWCGSGKKYKKCHLNRADANPFSYSALIDKQRKVLHGRKLCLHPSASKEDCDGPIVRAHTIQRSGGLSRIACNGHVLSFTCDHSAFPKRKYVYTHERIGVKEASTFTGFCRKHDCETFAPIEVKPFEFAPQQLCLLGYRCVCMELYKKEGVAEMEPVLRNMDMGKDLFSQLQIQHYVDAFSTGNRLARQELEAIKKHYETMIQTQDFSELSYYAIEIDSCPEVMCSTMFHPEVDFSNHRLQQIGDENKLAKQSAFSLIATDTGGAAVFTWFSDDSNGPCERFVQSLHQVSISDLPNIIVQFCFETSENVFFSPDWWDALTDTEQKRIAGRANSTGIDRPHDLGDDGTRVVGWQVKHIHTNIDSVDCSLT